jgi:hypothetical protein
MKILLFIVLFFPYVLLAQLPSVKNFTTLPSVEELNDTVIYNSEILWSVAVKNYVDLNQPDVSIQQVGEINIANLLIKDVLSGKILAYPFFSLFEELHAYSIRENEIYMAGQFYESDVKFLWDNDKTYRLASGEDIGYFYFTQHFYWNNNENKLTSNPVWLGVAKRIVIEDSKGSFAYMPVFRVPVKTNESSIVSKKLLWAADNYFEQQMPEEQLYLKKMLDKQLSELIWEQVEKERLLLKDTCGIKPLDLDKLNSRLVTVDDTTYFDPSSGIYLNVITMPIFDIKTIDYFGVLQRIEIYDDWSASIKIKGLKMFYTHNNSEPIPVGWIMFE